MKNEILQKWHIYPISPKQAVFGRIWAIFALFGPKLGYYKAYLSEKYYFRYFKPKCLISCK